MSRKPASTSTRSPAPAARSRTRTSAYASTPSSPPDPLYGAGQCRRDHRRSHPEDITEALRYAAEAVRERELPLRHTA
ncbi:MAG: hypothetical protein GEV28_28675 [Actinophytocola sp.]|nr:hypothetical protein [Actinophytocola sp.]